MPLARALEGYFNLVSVPPVVGVFTNTI